MTTTDLALRQQHAALARADEDERQWRQLMRRAEIIAKSGMVQKPLQGKPEDVAVVMLACQDLGLPVAVTTINQFHVIEGTPEPSAQLTLGLAHAAGYESTWGTNDDLVAELSISRPGRERWEHFRYTIEEAKRAHMLDEWVENWATTSNGKRYLQKYVVTCHAETPCRDARGDKPAWAASEISKGNIKHKDNWYNYPADMLRARAATRAVKAAAPEVRLGLVDRIHLEMPPGGAPRVSVMDAAELIDVEGFDDDDTSAGTVAAPAAAGANVDDVPVDHTAPAELVPVADAKRELIAAGVAEGATAEQAKALALGIWQAYRFDGPPTRKALDVALDEMRLRAQETSATGPTGEGEGTEPWPVVEEGETLFGEAE